MHRKQKHVQQLSVKMENSVSNPKLENSRWRLEKQILNNCVGGTQYGVNDRTQRIKIYIRCTILFSCRENLFLIDPTTTRKMQIANFRLFQQITRVNYDAHRNLHVLYDGFKSFVLYVGSNH